MKRAILFCVILLVVFAAKSQDLYTQEPWKITQHEITMTAYDKDLDAEAVVLYEIGNTSFLGNDNTGYFEMHKEIRTKIKILNQAGIKYAEFEIPFYEENSKPEMIRNLRAVTYNIEDGKLSKTELNDKNVFEEKRENNWKCKKFAMPNVKEGSVVEVSYTIVSPYLFNIDEWKFQKKIPVIYSRFSLKAVPYYEYTYIMKGAKKFDEYTHGLVPNSDVQWRSLKYKIYQYNMGMKDIPAFKDEEFITSEKDHMISLNFQLSKIHRPDGRRDDIMSTWPALCNDFLKHDLFGKYIDAAAKEAKKILPTLNLAGKSIEEQIKIITDYVKSNYSWNGNVRKMANSKVSDLLKQKRGNSAELNLFLAGMLSAANIKVQPILLSTRKNGKVSQGHPFESFLNYVIVQANTGEKNILLDATESMLLYNELPERCINVKGLVVEKNSEQWIDIVHDELALTEKEFDLKFNDNLTLLTSEIRYNAYAYDAYQYRAAYYSDTQNLYDLFMRRSVEPQGDIKVENYTELDKPFIISFKTESAGEGMADKLFIAPFLNQSQTDNLFKQKQRTLPVDLIHRHAAKFKSIIHIPEGYKVDYLPKEVKHDGKQMIINYTAVENPEKKQIEIIANYQFKNYIYEAKDYQTLKVLFDQMIKTFNETIVLSKI
ncbi:MAG: DUF3857 and transglutaminase domain-containing protein [Dysgonamonadaceae bacterium]|jgi:hypothetical protein|nr:DUF3857 and transglutaminase domain-containing protein [Dysgonamonadaceae bacterium]